MFLEFSGRPDTGSLFPLFPRPHCGVRRVMHFPQRRTSSFQQSPSPQGCLFRGRKASLAFTLSMKSNECPSLRREISVHFSWEEEDLPAVRLLDLPLPFLQFSPTFQPHALPTEPSQPQGNGFPGTRPQLSQACLLIRTVFHIFSSPKRFSFRRFRPQPPAGPASNLSRK